MVQYKLSYFDARGLAEMSRCILHYAGVPFEDDRFSLEDWPRLKSKMPFGQAPVLEVDGVQIPQSFAVARFLARKYGLAGKTEIESVLLDALAELNKDFALKIGCYFMVAAGRKQGDKSKIYKEVYLPAAQKHFPLLEKALAASDSGFYGRSGVSWVDFYLASAFLTAQNFAPEEAKKYPELVKHCERVHALPQLKEYFCNRKDSPL